MTEERIREMAKRIETEGEAPGRYKDFSINVLDYRDEGERVRWEVQRIARDSRVTVYRYTDTPTDAIRAAIAIIGRLETALQEDV